MVTIHSSMSFNEGLPEYAPDKLTKRTRPRSAANAEAAVRFAKRDALGQTRPVMASLVSPRQLPRSVEPAYLELAPACVCASLSPAERHKRARVLFLQRSAARRSSAQWASR